MTARPHLLVRLLVVVLGALAVHTGPGESLASAQTSTDVSDLRGQLDRRFEVLPLQDGVMLRPRVRMDDVRSIEIHEGSIALDGLVVTGAELRRRLGTDADLVVRVSFLSNADLRALTGPATAESAPAPAPQSPPEVAPPPFPDDDRRGRRARRGPFGSRGPNSGDRVRFGGTINVNEGETVDGDVVVIGGFARVMGRVTGEVVVVGGSAQLGPNADVTGDVVVVGGRLQRDPGARVGGEVEEVGVGPINISPNIDWPRWGWGPGWWGGNPFGGFFSLVSTVVRVGILCLLTAIVLLLGGGYVDRIRTLAAAEPLKAGAVGFLSQVLMVPLLVILTIVLIITIVGIPFLLLLPFAILALAVLALVGFTAVAREVGQLVMGRLRSQNTVGVFAATMAGVMLIVSPVLLGRLIGMGGGPLWLVSTPLAIFGFVVEYLAWTIGFGAVLFMLFGRRAPMAPPPLPQI
jgi:hypothetical protein